MKTKKILTSVLKRRKAEVKYGFLCFVVTLIMTMILLVDLNMKGCYPDANLSFVMRLMWANVYLMFCLGMKEKKIIKKLEIKK